MSIQYVVDTHTLLWFLYKDKRLSDLARTTVRAAEKAGGQVAVSAITLIEILFLVEKNRIQTDALKQTLKAIDQPNAFLIEIPIDRSIMEMMRRVERVQVPELPDRIIVATALSLNVPVITHDHKIQAANVSTIW